jgi:hypothetical protein
MTIKVEELPVAGKAIRDGMSFYFRPDDARRLVRECDERDIAVIGIDGLTLVEDDGIQPHLDLIADYGSLSIDWSGVSWPEFRQRCNSSALNFFDLAEAAGKEGELVFDISLMKNDEYAGFLQRRASWLEAHPDVAKALKAKSRS